MKKIALIATLSALSCAAAWAQYPTMGWSSWNTFAININEDLIKQQADAMRNTSLYDAGYRYINIDDGYFGGRDDEGNLLIHPVKFPNGLKPIVDYIHGKGLKAGIYSDAGHSTCACYFGGDTISHSVGLYGHDQLDADFFFGELGFDFIKVDFCGGSPYHNAARLKLSERERYTDIVRAMHNAAGDRDVRINACRWDYPGTWIGEVCGSWRTTGDINCSWRSVKNILRENLYLSAYSSKGHFNDMDMLEVGRGLSEIEDETHFGMWCIMNSPLLIGCDMRNIKPAALALMTNKELIALNQDVLAEQAYVADEINGCYVLVRDILKKQGNTRAIAIYNPNDDARKVELPFKDVDLAGKITARDLCKHITLTVQENTLSTEVPAHGVKIYSLKGQTRLERKIYEAETAKIQAYQELRNNQEAQTGIYEYDKNCRSGLKASWLGQSNENSLEWGNVYSQKGGQYKLTIAYQTQDTRMMCIAVNGKKVNKVKVSSGSNETVATTTMTITLNKGDNRIRLYNAASWMPNIDYIELTAL